MIILFMITGCFSTEFMDNQKMINLIDSMEITKEIITVETDSLGTVLDTVVTSKWKYDEDNKSRYLEEYYFFENEKRIIKEYYKTDEDLFYRKISNDQEGVLSIFETKSGVNGLVEESQHVELWSDKNDTLKMYSSYLNHPNGERKKRIIKVSNQDSENHMLYDLNGNPVFDYLIIDTDTVSYQSWEYVNSVLRKSIKINYQLDTSKLIWFFIMLKKQRR